jgi:hypothetical protein
MNGISFSGKETIGSIIENMFDNIALQFLGNLPRFKNKKSMVFSTAPNLGLSHLFVQAMENRVPNSVEQDALKGLLASADGYIESVKSQTKSNLIERIDGLTKEASLLGQRVSESAVQAAITEEMHKARFRLLAIVESEATKLRNIGSLMSISRMASSVGDNDPTVFFVVVRDNVTCKECIRLHMMPDGITPRLYKFSELKQSYHKRGDNSPSAFGLHPHCRCTLVYLTRGFGFDKKGKLDYQSEGYDLYAEQRKLG